MAVSALLIDLDDTLYDERDYVLSGFRVVAETLFRSYAIPVDASYKAMVDHLDATGRGKVFDAVLEIFNIPATDDLMSALVDTYRHHRPPLALYDGVAERLEALSHSYRLALVTDGLPLMQRRKGEALGIAHYFSALVYCWDLKAPKPSPGGFEAAASRLLVAIEDCAIIGDNPAHDGAAAMALDIPFMRCRTGRFREQPSPGPSLDFSDFCAAADHCLGLVT